PLTDSAIEIFKDLKENTNDTNSQFVFYKKTNSAEHMPTNTIAQAIITYKRATKLRPFITRDIRRTVKTLGGEVEIPKEYRDRIQGHAINDVSGRHYDMYEYLKEKRKGL
ncbi:integrase, partial [Vibrio sp. Vb2880]|nr:integrase [Vibrio sp. Vb2880]